MDEDRGSVDVCSHIWPPFFERTSISCIRSVSHKLEDVRSCHWGSERPCRRIEIIANSAAVRVVSELDKNEARPPARAFLLFHATLNAG